MSIDLSIHENIPALFAVCQMSCLLTTPTMTLIGESKQGCVLNAYRGGEGKFNIKQQFYAFAATQTK